MTILSAQSSERVCVRPERFISAPLYAAREPEHTTTSELSVSDVFFPFTNIPEYALLSFVPHIVVGLLSYLFVTFVSATSL